MSDSTLLRTPAHRGRNRVAQESEALGRSKSGLTTKIHTAVDDLDHPIRFILTSGQASDCTQAEPLLAGFPAQYVIANKGYDSKTIVKAVERSGAQAVTSHAPVSKIPATRTSLCTPSAPLSSASSAGSSTIVPSRLATPTAPATSPTSSILRLPCSGDVNHVDHAEPRRLSMKPANRRHDISDRTWQLLDPHVPGRKSVWAALAKDNRLFLNALFWV